MAAREPFASKVSRTRKRKSGRTEVVDTPLAIRGNIRLEDRQRDDVRKRLGRRLAKYATNIERVSVRFDDENGPKGGVDVRCRAKVVLSALPSVVVEERAENVDLAIRRITGVLGRAVARALDKRGFAASGVRKAKRPRRKSAVPVEEEPTFEPAIARSRKARSPKATVQAEDSVGRPSRKSTRRSANRSKPANTLERRELHRTYTPQAKARRARAKAGK